MNKTRRRLARHRRSVRRRMARRAYLRAEIKRWLERTPDPMRDRPPRHLRRVVIRLREIAPFPCKSPFAPFAGLIQAMNTFVSAHWLWR